MYTHYTGNRKNSSREPSLLEVLYPPKEAGTKTYRPAHMPIAPPVSESEKFFGMLNGVIHGIGLAFLIGWGMIALLVCIALSGMQ